jgi:putative flavoprotein involved in K+ transport
MPTVDSLVIGAGQAGLATSRLLTEAGRDHVVLERGHVGERWRTERWDSLRMVTPNWMLRLPGSRYAGPEQDGFTAAGRFVSMLPRRSLPPLWRAPTCGRSAPRGAATPATP